MGSSTRYRIAHIVGCLAILGACNFSDTVLVGRNVHSGGAGGSIEGAAGTPPLETGAGGGAGSRALCGLETPSRQLWVTPTESARELARGQGGPIPPGEYQLSMLVHNPEPTCFEEPVAVAQSIFLGSDGAGSVVTAYDWGEPNFASTFRFTVEGASIAIQTTCTEPAGTGAKYPPFGGFESYTASDHTLELISEACRYRAEYWFMPNATSR